ncbi:hypothetical protein GCM10009760_18440 [Kitasatospora kazusensis]|uniref:Uncharacterized protein n=1 Tax=Kitasatospora kazusensis TaxID=407974 RepID=A0ABP5KUP5_9ACTN
MPDVPNFQPQCASCGLPPVVQWRRRSADDPTHTVTVLACAAHGITRDLAAHVHAATCTAPDPAHLPACGCTVEPIDPEPAFPAAAPVALPSGW